MKLFKCHAVMSRGAGARSHLVRTYVMMASTWQEARARIRDREPCVEFVTVPVEISGALIVEVKLISECEFADLRSACEWNEGQLGDANASLGHGAKG
jgi:hypothetical protein